MSASPPTPDVSLQGNEPTLRANHFAPLKNSEPFVRGTTAKLVADLPIGA